MNNKTKIITSAAAAFGLAIGTVGVLGYRNIDDQWQALEQSKTEFSETSQQAQLTIEQRESALLEREKVAEQKLLESKKMAALAEQKSLSSRKKMTAAKQLDAEIFEARKVVIKQQELATDIAEKAEQSQVNADKIEREFRSAKVKAEAEFAQSLKLQTKLIAEIKATQYALAKTIKVESTTIWHQNKAKKSIEQAECDIADAAKRKREAESLNNKAKQVFHQLNRLECELEEKCDEIEDLEKKQRGLLCKIRDLESKHRKNLDDSFKQLKRQNSEYYTKINKHKYELTKLKRDLDKVVHTDNKQKALISKQERQIKQLESDLRKKK